MIMRKMHKIIGIFLQKHTFSFGVISGAIISVPLLAERLDFWFRSRFSTTKNLAMIEFSHLGKIHFGKIVTLLRVNDKHVNFWGDIGHF